MAKKIFNPGKYGMKGCPSCDSRGFIQNPRRQCCPECGGFGFVIKGTGQDANNSICGVTESFLEKEEC